MFNSGSSPINSLNVDWLKCKPSHSVQYKIFIAFRKNKNF
uniref:Uncharacterized protein n=1 Tax=Anguilla anguilla TaxID=7936 RepID=A0A0E9WXM1_ANGAN